MFGRVAHLYRYFQLDAVKLCLVARSVCRDVVRAVEVGLSSGQRLLRGGHGGEAAGFEQATEAGLAADKFGEASRGEAPELTN